MVGQGGSVGRRYFSPLCGGIYKEEGGYIAPWSVTEPDSKTNCFSWTKKETDWIAPEDLYRKEFNKW